MKMRKTYSNSGHNNENHIFASLLIRFIFVHVLPTFLRLSKSPAHKRKGNCLNVVGSVFASSNDSHLYVSIWRHMHSAHTRIISSSVGMLNGCQTLMQMLRMCKSAKISNKWIEARTLIAITFPTTASCGHLYRSAFIQSVYISQSLIESGVLTGSTNNHEQCGHSFTCEINDIVRNMRWWSARYVVTYKENVDVGHLMHIISPANTTIVATSEWTSNGSGWVRVPWKENYGHENKN